MEALERMVELSADHVRREHSEEFWDTLLTAAEKALAQMQSAATAKSQALLGRLLRLLRILIGWRGGSRFPPDATGQRIRTRVETLVIATLEDFTTAGSALVETALDTAAAYLRVHPDFLATISDNAEFFFPSHNLFSGEPHATLFELVPLPPDSTPSNSIPPPQTL